MIDDALLQNVPEVDGYRVLDPCVLYAKLGEGGMGSVFRGFHLNLQIEVAVKCLRPTLAGDDPRFIERFQHEASLAAHITHTNLTRVYDVRRRHGVHYLILEFVRGENVRQRVRRKGPLAPVEAAQIVLGSCLGLYSAHQQGIVHRDIKPDNLMITRRGVVKVADLGLAKAVDAGDSVTRSRTFLGTPQYMSPEQFEDSSTVGPNGDVYALGATLFFVLTGKNPVKSGSTAEMMNRVLHDPFPDVRRFRKDVPDELLSILHRCVEKDPDRRYSNAGQLAKVLRAFTKGAKSQLADKEAGANLEAQRAEPPDAETLEWIKSRVDRGDLRKAPRARAVRTSSSWKPFLGPIISVLILATAGIGYWWTYVRDKPAPVGENSIASEIDGEETVSPAAAPAPTSSQAARDIRSRIEGGDLDGAYESLLSSLVQKKTSELLDLRQELEQSLRERLLEAVEYGDPRPGSHVDTREFTVFGRCSPAVQRLTVDGDEVQRVSEYDFTYPVQVKEDGPVRFRFQARDRHGISVDLPVLDLVVDSLPPSLEIVEPVPSAWLKSLPVRIRGVVADVGSPVASVTVNGEPGRIDGDQFEASLEVTEGRHEIEIVARDAAGHVARKTLEIRLDTERPAVTFEVPEDTLSPGPITLTGTIEDSSPCRVLVNDEEAEVEDGHWTRQVELGPGFHRFVVEARDAAGNKDRVTERIQIAAELDWADAAPDSEVDHETGFPTRVIHRRTGIEMVLVPGGTYVRGASDDDDMAQPDERPRQTVRVEPFYLGRYEVTVGQYRKLVRSHLKENFNMAFGKPDLPVTMVSWNNASNYSRRMGLRLPTEDEWEYACRAGTTTRFPWGDSAYGGEGWGNVADLSVRKKRPQWKVFSWNDGYDTRPAPVGSFKANAFGLHDMIGNVMEWVEDTYSVGKRVRRGGSWASKPLGCRSSDRDADQVKGMNWVTGSGWRGGWSRRRGRDWKLRIGNWKLEI